MLQPFCIRVFFVRVVIFTAARIISFANALMAGAHCGFVFFAMSGVARFHSCQPFFTISSVCLSPFGALFFGVHLRMVSRFLP